MYDRTVRTYVICTVDYGSMYVVCMYVRTVGFIMYCFCFLHTGLHTVVAVQKKINQIYCR